LRWLLGWLSAPGLPRQRTLFKVNGLAAAAARLRPIEFIRKNFFFFSTFRAFTGKRFKIFKVCKSGAVLRGVCHVFILSVEGLFRRGVIYLRAGVFITRQDAGLLPAEPDSGNCLTGYRLQFKTGSPTKTESVFCLLGRQSPATRCKHRGDHLGV
jgi:hypothetical protein